MYDEDAERSRQVNAPRVETVMPARGSLTGFDRRAVVVGRPAWFGAVPAFVALTVVWVGILIAEGPVEALKYSWLLAMAAYLGAYTFLRRLRIEGSALRLTVIGPWRQSVDLESLESIRWKHTGGALSRGSMFVRDRFGRKVRIGVGDFDGIEEWGPLLLKFAQVSGAIIDDTSRRILAETGPPGTRRA
jgi:hypothetical protein